MKCHGHKSLWSHDLLICLLNSIGFSAYSSKLYTSKFEELKNIEGHHKVIGKDFNDIETICVEAIKQPKDEKIKDFSEYMYTDKNDDQTHYFYNVRALEYQQRETGYIDYNVYKNKQANVYLRGNYQEIDIQQDFACFVGGAQTFGCFCESFPYIVHKKSGMPCLNLGIGGAGPRNFIKDELLDIINKSKVCVLQIMSGRSSECNGYSNPDGNVDYLIDGDWYFTGSIWGNVIDKNSKKHRIECMERWVEDYKTLISKIEVPVILLYISTMQVNKKGDWVFPQFVRQEHLDNLIYIANEYVSYHKGSDSFSELKSGKGTVNDKYYPDQEMHNDVAELIIECLAKYR